MTGQKVRQDNAALRKVEEMVRDMQFGSITIVVQDGKIIQIDRTEKHRWKS